jgi:hypothetical protein
LGAALYGPETVQRRTCSIDDPPKQRITDLHRASAAGRYHPGIRLEPIGAPGRHQQQPVTRETDDLGLGLHTVPGQQKTAVANGGMTASRFERETDQPCQTTLHRGHGKRGGAPCVASQTPAERGGDGAH